jgi:hypothetical protein
MWISVKYTVINVFQQNYDTRLRSWYELRKKIEYLDFEIAYSSFNLILLSFSLIN